ncbi:carboxypeptidase-like regulatory domain-containing protein [Granulicella sp. dw_53]|uniref:carboxypeptidase-like regulatory domain-containing protein n=1 Tax=Granulicella sp. dw_53 TaxID=2719792 RepID=UPI002107850B|nr:carboxypeptidase-like regulatory domain-containing protein [Granulicella sp. dw_53]
MQRLVGHLLYGFCFVLLAHACFAQSTFGTVRGTVQDSSGAAIPGATVTVHSITESTDRSVTTDDAGQFDVENLKPGSYSVMVQRDGFGKALVPSVLLAARQELRLPMTLKVATDNTTVEVVAQSTGINTENGVIADEKSNIQITQLPLNNRATTTSPLGALTLSPNVQQDSQGNLSIGGASSSMVNFSVDGISTANVRQNGALQDAYPSQEGISAVKVTAFNNSAEFSQVGDVTFVTKGGGNQFHGSVFEYLQNDALDASPYGFSGKAPKRFNTFGGSLGGPVVLPKLYNGHDHTFFFATYEANRRTTSVAQQFLVPTVAERNGDLTALGGGIIPASQINPTAKALLAFYPLPNVAGQSNINYENFQSTPASTDGADVRIDQTVNAKQSVYARFSRKNITSDVANPFLPNDEDSIHNRSFLVSYTYSITPRLLNEFRFGFTNVITNVNFPIEGADALTQLGLTGVDISQHPTTHAFPTFNFSSGTGFTPIGRDKTGVTKSKTLQLTDNVTFSWGKHTIKGGIDVRRVRYQDTELFLPSDDFGQFTFGPTVTGNTFGDFLNGTPTTLFFAVSSPDVAGTAWQYSLFAQDEYQVSRRLTLSYGLRWQVLPGFTGDGGNFANFDQRTNSIVVPDALSGYLQQNNLQGSNLAFQQSFNACNLGNNSLPCTNYVTASQDKLPQSLRKTYKGNFQPRVSLAYRPFSDTKTVVRAGFGIFTMTNLGPLSFNNSGNPTSNLHTYTNCTPGAQGCTQPLIQFPNTAPASTTTQIGGGSLDQGVDPNYRDPQSNQWNLTVERQLTRNDTFRASYVGMHTYRLNITEDLNQIPASTTPFQTTAASPFVDPRAPYPNWFELFSTFNAGTQNYSALELEVTHAPSHGLYFDAAYTLAKNLADNQGDTPTVFAGEVNYGVPITDRFNVSRNYGNVSGTRHNRALISGAYQLPFGPGRHYLTSGWMSQVLGGWELNTVSLLETGPWLTPSISPGGSHIDTPGGPAIANDQSNTNVTNRGATLRPDVVSQNFSKGQTRDHFFNLAAFTPTPQGAGRFGNAGVGILQGPGTVAVSLGTAKVFRVNERVRVRFESSFSNVLNHTNFAPPPTQIDSPTTFGVLSAPQTAENAGNRTGQAALRVDF